MLTDLEIRSTLKSCGATGASVTLRDIGERGGGRLVVVVRRTNQGGSAEWYASWHRDGQRKLTKIGRYPALTIREARSVFRERYLPLILDGRDPTGPRAFAKMRGQTVQDLFEAYVEYLRFKQRRSTDDVHRILLGPRGAVHDIGAKRFARDVEPRHITPHLAKIRGRGSIGQANLVRGYISAAFSFGMTAPNAYDGSEVGLDWGLRFNPGALVKVDPEAFRARVRILSREEFAAFWWWLTDQRSRNRMAFAVQLMMLTGQRPDEIMQLSSSLLQERADEIAWPKTKNGHPHFIPLLGIAKAVVEMLEPNSFGHYFWRPGRPELRAKVTAPRRLVHQFLRDTGTRHFTPHDLRRIWKSLGGDAQIPKEVRDLLQNHRRSDVSSRHYDHYDYRREKRDGMATWDAYVDALLKEHPRKAVGRLFRFGEFVFDDGNGELIADGRRLHLRRAEARLLSVLLIHAGEVLSPERLVVECTTDEHLTPGAIKLRVSRLRSLLGPSGGPTIETCRGKGYRIPLSALVDDDESSTPRSADWPRAA